MKRFARIAVVISAVSLLFTVVQPASAITQVTTHTKMTVSDTKIHKGDVVKFKVTLTASKAKCTKNMPIILYRAGDQVGQKTTNDQGKVVFKKKGQHPKRLNCLGSQSKKIKVVVKP